MHTHIHPPTPAHTPVRRLPTDEGELVDPGVPQLADQLLYTLQVGVHGGAALTLQNDRSIAACELAIVHACVYACGHVDILLYLHMRARAPTYT